MAVRVTVGFSLRWRRPPLSAARRATGAPLFPLAFRAGGGTMANDAPENDQTLIRLPSPVRACGSSRTSGASTGAGGLSLGCAHMAGDWITMRMDLHGDPAVILIAARCQLEEDAVVGKLHRLWSWASYQLTDGHARGVTETWVDAHVRCDGFASAMQTAGWLVIGNNDSVPFVSFPKWDTWLSNSAKTRELANRRQRNRRNDPVTQMSRSDSDKNVTHCTVIVPVSDSLPSVSSSEGVQGKPKTDSAVEIPGGLDTPDFRAAWSEWLAYRRERKLGKPTGMTIRATFRRFDGDMGPERAAAAIRHSIEKGWQSINEAKEFTSGSGTRINPAGRGGSAKPSEYAEPPDAATRAIEIARNRGRANPGRGLEGQPNGHVQAVREDGEHPKATR